MTNKEIARQLGISPAALSLILNHKPGISEATRERVLLALQDMGCHHLIQKAAAAALTNTLCFVIYKRHGEILDLHPFFLLLMETIEEYARSNGYHILLCTIDKRKPLLPQIQHINESAARGAILFATEMQGEDLEAFKALQMPFVALDNHFARLPCNTIAIDNQMGTFQAIAHLVEAGHTRIGYLKSSTRISSFLERQMGYESALAYFHFSLPESRIWTVHYTEEGSYRDICQRLAKQPRAEIPNAFVCDDDTIAAGALRAFQEHGYRIPADLSMIGFNDRPVCEMTSPPLTSVNVSKNELATEAVDELLRLIRNRDGGRETRPRKIRIGTKLTVRASTNTVPKPATALSFSSPPSARY